MSDDSAPWYHSAAGHRARIVTPGSATQGSCTVIEYIEPPHSPPPLYTQHAFVEVFYILEGSLMFQFTDEAPQTLHSGHSVTCPPWKAHSFWNVNDAPARALIVCSPAGLDDFFREFFPLTLEAAAYTQVPQTLTQKMADVRGRYGVERLDFTP